MVLDMDTNAELTFTLSDRRFSLSARGVAAALTDQVPETIHTYWVEIDGLEWPVKQVLSLATGIAPREFQSSSAQRLLDKLGFEVKRRVDREPKKTPTAHKPKSDAKPKPTIELPSPDAVLISCSKGKLGHGASAKDLYSSPYFSFMREYAERKGQPWFILSAKHGLVSPDAWLEPYDEYLPNSTRSYRHAWGERVAQQLAKELGPLSDKVIEIHAGNAYVAALGTPLLARGAVVTEPLKGLQIGLRLAWYRARQSDSNGLQSLMRQLGDKTRRQSVDEFLTSNDESLGSAGIYAWWVDSVGAAELSDGLGEVIKPGLLYAGLAGATRSSGKRSQNTLRKRIATMHLGKKYSFSTLRWSVGSILTAARGSDSIDEERLTEWMRSHLQIVAVPVTDVDALGEVESRVLAALDPPLNIAKVSSKTPVRIKLSALRARYSVKKK